MSSPSSGGEGAKPLTDGAQGNDAELDDLVALGAIVGGVDGEIQFDHDAGCRRSFQVSDCGDSEFFQLALA